MRNYFTKYREAILLLLLFNAINVLAQTTTSSQISSSMDDIEELYDGVIYSNSTDLELIFDPKTYRLDQTIGLRFNNIDVPQGATILDAYIQFTANEVKTGATNLTIKGEATNNAVAFDTIDYNVSGRNMTNAVVNWTPPDWNTIGDAGFNERTPNLAPIISEIVNRAGFVQNNSIAMIITGSGVRIAEAYDGAPSLAPKLFITYCAAGQACNATASLSINEVMADNETTITDNNGQYEDWIEIYNAGNTAVNLADYYITDDPTDPTKWRIPNSNPAQTTVAANDFLLLWADDDLSEGAHHINFKLSSAGESIYLFNPDGTILLDQLTFTDLQDDQSYGRNTEGDAQLLTFTQSTPNSSNANGVSIVGQPFISPLGGVYTGNQTITISTVTTGATIYYTTNGDEPTTASTVYNGPFTINSSKGIRAIAVKNGSGNSEITTESYVFYNTDLPIITITADPDNLWSDNAGIYVIGTNGITGNCMSDPCNFNQDWERPATVSMIETDGEQVFNENAGISISGGCSRRSAQRSINISAKSIYGSSSFKHQIFPSSEQDKFKRFKLRNGGQGFTKFPLRDVITQSLIENEVDVDYQRSRSAVVFINGNYWGIMNIRDVYSEHYIEEHHKIASKDSIDLLKPYGTNEFAEIIEGSQTDYNTLYNYIESNNMANQNHYDYVKNKIDISEYINYQIIQIYVHNTDWPGNNVRIWKEQSPNSKFRWMLFDTDYSLGHTRNTSNPVTQADYTKNSLAFATDPNGSGWPNDAHATMILRKLLQNAEFKNEFTQRFATQMATIFETNRAQAIADNRYNILQNEKAAHFNRWNGEPDARGNNTNISSSLWQTEFDYIRDWFSQRQPYMRDHIKDYFGIAGTYTLTIPVDASTNGYVVLNENEYQAPYNYSGIYFDGIPMRIRAIPNPGYRFSHWLENNNTNPIHTFTTSNSRTRTPVFVPAEELVINEIHYHPITGAEEFVELYNPDSQAKDLSGYYFSNGGLCLIFPEGTSIAANEYIVVARNAAIYTGNGYQVFDWEEGELDNSGEKLVLKNSIDMTIDSVDYNDGNSWPLLADGFGSSLELNYPLPNDNIAPSDWHSSTANGGTPGTQNATVCNTPTDEIVINEINYNSNPAVDPSNWVEIYNPNTYAVDLSNWLFCDSGNSFTIPQGTTLAADSYLVLVEEVTAFANVFPNLNLNSDYIGGFNFNLSNNGERLSLFDTNNCLSDEVIYDDVTPWVSGTDGTGQTLALIAPTLDNSLPMSWDVSTTIASPFVNGSPARSNSITTVYAKILLEGFYDTATSQMHTHLQNNNLLPLSQPYNVAPWNYGGTESVNAIPIGVVDWILIMTRDATGNVLQQSAGFVNQSGELVATDGTLGVLIDDALGNTISIHHRSHLAVLSAIPYDGTLYDFTIAASQAQGTQQLKSMAGKYTLYAGDFDANGLINSSDFNDWKIQSAVLNQYLPIDGDGNGIINAADYNLWINNRSKVGEQDIRY